MPNSTVNREAHKNLRRLQKLYRKRPDSLLFSSLAEAYLNCGMVTDALQTALEGLIIYPDCLSARMVLARCYLVRGDAERAIVELEKIILQSPDHIMAQRLIIACYEKEGQLSRALASAKKILNNYSHDEDLKSRIKRWEKEVVPDELDLFIDEEAKPNPIASAESTEGFQMRPVNDLFDDKEYETTILGDIYKEQGHLDKALSVYEKVLEQKPSDEVLKQKVEKLRSQLFLGQLAEQDRWERALKRLSNDTSKAKQINLLSDMLAHFQEKNDGA